jgi:uncharacterized protein (DUF1499 family)
MTPLAWFLGLFLPACGATGASGLPPPRLMDTSHIQRPNSPNTALAAPADFSSKPDIVTPTYDVPAPQLYTDLLAVTAAEPRTFVTAKYEPQLQAQFVARSAWLNFPDLIVAQVTASGSGASTLALYSHSVYGYGDIGVNRARLVSWLAALDRSLQSTKER